MIENYLESAARALGDSAKAKAVAAASNNKAITCSGCMANDIGSQDQRFEQCGRMYRQFTCQRIIWLASMLGADDFDKCLSIWTRFLDTQDGK